MRGKHQWQVDRRLRHGITPARAGKTAGMAGRFRPSEDHPRACGENRSYNFLDNHSGGSPPRVRGKPNNTAQTLIKIGITPARAGKTCSGDVLPNSERDHPRACGENTRSCPAAPCAGGSPPRVRGKPTQAPPALPRRRITPARAGKTPIALLPRCSPPDHPRACGENYHIAHKALRCRGSPPRVRGKPVMIVVMPAPPRITPARAGKTARCRAGIGEPEDHPRACGENRTIHSRASSVRGSPPRVRGKHTPNQSANPAMRITPARAGKTASACALPARSSDHPRACGENFPIFIACPPARGSPPRVRGKPEQAPPARHRQRITPARAGKTK